MRLSDYRHIIWDWNGTLLDDAWLCVDIMNRMLLERGLPGLTLERYQQLFDFPVIEYYRRLGYDFERESFEILGTLFIDTYETRRHECRLQDGVQELICRLHRAGIAQTILSAYKHASLQEAVLRYRLAEFFLETIGIEDHYADGKTGQGLRHIATLGLDPTSVLFIGDTTHDHEVASAMGVNCWLVTSGNHTREKLLTCGVPVFGSLREMPF